MFECFLFFSYCTRFPTCVFEEIKCRQLDADSLRLCTITLFFFLSRYCVWCSGVHERLLERLLLCEWRSRARSGISELEQVRERVSTFRRPQLSGGRRVWGECNLERKRKLLNWLKCPLDETPKIDERAENPSAAFGGFAWEPKSNGKDPGHCWVVIDKKCLRLNNVGSREQRCALVLAGRSCKVEFNSDSYTTAKQAVPYWWSANTPSPSRPAACT